MRDYCWSLVGTGLGCDPEKKHKKERSTKIYLNFNTGDFASFSWF